MFLIIWIKVYLENKKIVIDSNQLKIYECVYVVRLLDKLLLFLECYFVIIVIYFFNNMLVVIRIFCLDVKIFNLIKVMFFVK